MNAGFDRSQPQNRAGLGLTLQKPPTKSNGKVSTDSLNRYAQWREQNLVAPMLREAGDDSPSEQILQKLWLHQRLLRDRLQTLDGRQVRILHPGFWNHEAGPDFRQALIQFDAEPPRSGDVEIDLQTGGWRAHGHAQNADYENVILHVVWEERGRNDSKLPTLALKSKLDSPLTELISWMGAESGTPALLAGQCSAPLSNLSAPILADILQQAGQVRLQSKAAYFHARARQAGWEQSLWEGLFAALGYKQNVWPMRRVAELLPRLTTCSFQKPSQVFALQARLLGISGLLPAELTRIQTGTDNYLRRIWDHWWRERDEFNEWILPRALWRFNGLRPANHPQRRLALAAHWLASGKLLSSLENWFTASVPDIQLVNSLLKVLQAESDDFWSWHWTFRSARMRKPQPLLGAQRVTDLAVNVILPWFWMRAVAGQNTELRARAEHRYFAWPKAEDNAVLRLARQRLLGASPARILGTAAMQQGLLQIVRDFCERSDAVCTDCRFPELVRSLDQ